MIKTTLMLLLLLINTLTFGQTKTEDDAIKAVIESAYVSGIHNGGSIEEIRKGFHPTFKMLSLENNDISSLSLEDWIIRIENGRKQNAGNPTIKAECEYLSITTSGNAATVVLNLFKNKKKIFTDHMMLYKFSEGWRIVSKAYYRIPR
ncbi:nuclear transport factor 2 family protein [Flavobacterium sp. ZT3R18]|uniref:nuclear transport factor 2 family protein n=1 Tax=Flavobacterium sp. ZT3R18 TaxID=2594429 RepID=UPI00117A1BDD|nr:nuclear transport factor 2 family protein [Flavobacterium sp. ZT3R18]TRX38728.1 nuclear transport factor 2 family protein [Flavobacterium sp. ZT3R18]